MHARMSGSGPCGRGRSWFVLGVGIIFALVGSACSPGEDGAPGSSCTTVQNPDGSATITCTDGTSTTVPGGDPGAPGAPGSSGGGAEVLAFHGLDFLRSTGPFAAGRVLVDLTITSASADTSGVAVVAFSVQDADGNPVTDVPSVRATIAKLTPPPSDEANTRWVPYLYRTETVIGDTFPNPAGTTADQADVEDNGTLVNHGDGTYTYTFATNLGSVTVGGAPVTYERNRTHRMAVMLGGLTGATGNAAFDFVPDASGPVGTRDIVRTETCRNCHGALFQAHEGDRRSVEICAVCHVPGTWDAQGGESLDLKVLLHKIHVGGQLQSVPGPDGDPWATADNGSYALWGDGDTKREWWKVKFPAQAYNCTACHTGAGADVGNWSSDPSRAACGACHDGVNWATGTNHAGGPQANDANCNACHPASVGLSPIVVAHDPADGLSPIYDPRNIPEFTLDVTLSAPSNGSFYEAGEAPLVTIVIKENGTPLADHAIAAGSAEGCIPSGTPLSCPADIDGAFYSANLLVHGPRARRMPVLTTRARAEVISPGAGPFDLTGATELALLVDHGRTVTGAADQLLPGRVTATYNAAYFANPAAATAAEIANWLNLSSVDFENRALAFVDGSGLLHVRSRNLGTVYGIQLEAGTVTTSVFGGDTTVHGPSGGNSSNNLRTNSADPKVSWFADRIVYQLDPVDDLAPGTYVVSLEIARLGRLSSVNYRTPSVAKLSFQVKTATEELPVARNCNACHQNSTGQGLVLDYSRHYKILDDTAPDQCGACHDQQPQNPADPAGLGAWTGTRPLSKRVHAIHFGSSLQHPLRTVDYAAGDPVAGRNWDITFSQDVRNCESCHTPQTSGTWATKASRLSCWGCHDADATVTHMKLMTYDPTPLTPWSGDEEESCTVCH